ncbi:hypothetical protein AB395_00004595 (plasmid) [Sinorhizobium fredii CCBAU 45436]|nr:hypothetical protein AB395_00004595 [Sinorhizobium fredii CCBAU 45436]
MGGAGFTNENVQVELIATQRVNQVERAPLPWAKRKHRRSLYDRYIDINVENTAKRYRCKPTDNAAADNSYALRIRQIQHHFSLSSRLC